MLKASDMKELCDMMSKAEPGQMIGVSRELFHELIHDRPFVQNFKQSEEKITHCNNKDEAQALANFLWNEAKRYETDLTAINIDLDLLWTKWHVVPSCIY